MKNHLIFRTLIIVLFSDFIFNVEGLEAKFVDQPVVSKNKTVKSIEFYNEGTKHLLSGHYEKAISLFLNAVRHTSPKMIIERYYSYIKNYQSDDGLKFMERVYSPIMENDEKTTPNLPHHQKEGISAITNSL
jgi:outer membrane protein assembly factor BamD (BamD/ComL family)